MTAVRVRISTAARRILRILAEHQDGEYTLDELAREAHASKTATSHALHELEDAGIVAIVEEGGE
jgi:uncharacterized membrane protein